MKPAPFEYYAPLELPEALDLLERYGDDAKILAGGQSLMPLINLRLARPRVIIDINRLRDLDAARWRPDDRRAGASADRGALHDYSGAKSDARRGDAAYWPFSDSQPGYHRR
jgi:carbon-monoxide dehydrogenase medium subunit